MKQRYRPRFGSGRSIISNKIGYDETLAEDMRQQNNRMASIMQNLPKWRREQASHKAGAVIKKRATKKRDDMAERIRRREEAEARLADTLRACANALEMGLAELKEIGSINVAYQGSVNQFQIHNALVLLKNKCGVVFDRASNEHLHKVMLDRVHVKEGYVPLWDRNKKEKDAELAMLRDAERIFSAEDNEE